MKKNPCTACKTRPCEPESCEKMIAFKQDQESGEAPRKVKDPSLLRVQELLELRNENDVTAVLDMFANLACALLYQELKPTKATEARGETELR